jgi:hypothetical protein
MYMQISRRVADRSRLFAVVRLESGASIAARGEVVRIEQRPRGLFGVAVRFKHAKLIPARETGTPPASAATGH